MRCSATDTRGVGARGASRAHAVGDAVRIGARRSRAVRWTPRPRIGCDDPRLGAFGGHSCCSSRIARFLRGGNTPRSMATRKHVREAPGVVACPTLRELPLFCLHHRPHGRKRSRRSREGHVRRRSGLLDRDQLRDRLRHARISSFGVAIVGDRLLGAHQPLAVGRRQRTRGRLTSAPAARSQQQRRQHDERRSPPAVARPPAGAPPRWRRRAGPDR